ncbi:MAG: hypothetical protein M1482_02505, partial [Chloroflexi bacterium]|nr:hypothetical protein [Chloroflexota bacterium]
MELGEERRLVHQSPFGMVGQRLPPKKHERLDRLVGGVGVPRVDLVVGSLYPADICIAPAGVRIGLGDKDRQGAESGREAAQIIAVRAKIKVPIGKRRAHGVFTVELGGVKIVCVAVKRDPICLISDQIQNVQQVAYPVA